MSNKKTNGFSLVEMLIMITLFVILVTVSTQSIILSVRASRKTEAMSRVQENLSYALSVIERNLYNAKGVTCPNPNPTRLDYEDSLGAPASFSCDLTNYYVASGSARLTSSEVQVSSCSFTCTPSFPPSVSVMITGFAIGYSDAEAASVTEATNINLRTY